MNKELEAKISKMRRIFSRLPPAEKKMPIVEVENKILSWEEAYREVIKKSEISEKILKRLEELGLL